MKAILMVCAALLLTSCVSQEDREEAAMETARSFSQPEVVGTLPDGREVKVVVRVIPQQHSHFIYFVENGGVTTNREVSVGKTTQLQVDFIAPEVDTAEARQVEAAVKLDKAVALRQEALLKLREADNLVKEAQAEIVSVHP